MRELTRYTIADALYLRDDPHLADDVVFGSSDDLAVGINPNDPDCPIPGGAQHQIRPSSSSRRRGRQNQRPRRF